jgi:outer membrane protein TolC
MARTIEGTAMLPPRRCRSLAAAAALLMLGGCATFSEDRGFTPVAQAARTHLQQDLRWPRNGAERSAADQRIDELLARPLGADDAVQLALLNNRGLQAAFEDLAISEADLVQAGRLPNPGISLARMTRGHEVEIERGVHLGLARLLALPLARQVESRRLAQVQSSATQRVLALAADVRQAWVQAVAAEQSAGYARQVMASAEASAELARRMAQAGNFNTLQRAREQGFYAEAALGLARAQQAQSSARERLTRLLGLWGAQTAFSLPERLPDLPGTVPDRPDIEREALAQRLDVAATKLMVEQTAKQLGLTRTTRLVNVLELGYARNSSNEEPVQRGWEIAFELPLFDWGEARAARAEGVYRQALHRAAGIAVNARSEVREAYARYRHAHDIARHHRDELVPLRQRIAEENLLRYNGMLIGVFELLADARAQVNSVNAAIEAERDFWLAEAELQRVLLGPAATGSPLPSAAGPAAGAAADAGGH